MTTQRLIGIVTATGAALLLSGCTTTEPNEYDSLESIRADVEASGHICDLYEEYNQDDPSGYYATEMAWCQSNNGDIAMLSRFGDAESRQNYTDTLRVADEDVEETQSAYPAVEGSDWIVECSFGTDICEQIAEHTNGSHISLDAVSEEDKSEM